MTSDTLPNEMVREIVKQMNYFDLYPRISDKTILGHYAKLKFERGKTLLHASNIFLEVDGGFYYLSNKGTLYYLKYVERRQADGYWDIIWEQEVKMTNVKKLAKCKNDCFALSKDGLIFNLSSGDQFWPDDPQPISLINSSGDVLIMAKPDGEILWWELTNSPARVFLRIDYTPDEIYTIANKVFILSGHIIHIYAYGTDNNWSLSVPYA